MSDQSPLGVSGGEAPAPHHKRCGRQPTHYGAGQFSAWPSDCKTPGAGGMPKETAKAVSAPAVYLHKYINNILLWNLNKKSEVGNFLLSQEAALQVPSADTRLTAGFGMFPGIPTLLWSPTSLLFFYSLTGDCPFTELSPFFPTICSFFSQVLSPEFPPEDFPVPYTTQKPSIISTGLLNTLLYFHLRPIQQVVSLRSYTFQSRELISKRVSHLDAFSGYLFRTWLLSGAPGGTTDTPEVRPPRSSRTRGSPSQFSFAHSG